MFWIIENLDQVEKFSTKGYNEIFMQVIPLKKDIHPTLNSISLIYVRPINTSRGYLFCINHSESLNLELDKVIDLLNKLETIYVIDKKETLHYLKLNNLYDIGFNGNIKQNTPTQAHKFFNNKNNNFIPLSKHYELCDLDYNSNIDLLHKPNEFLNTKVSEVFNLIEKEGIYINKEIFKQHFYETDEYVIHTNFNLKTTTTRPSNSYNGVNFMALNKTNGCRKAFIPKNNYYIELDIKSYHPVLISKLIDYDFKGQNPHTYLANIYGVDYDKSKLITFRQIYGGIYKEYKDVEFFIKVQNYIDGLWESFNNKGYVEVPISNHKILHKNNLDIKKQTLFNYILQGYETSLNIEIMYEIQKLLEKTTTKLIHYTYDSFLLDVLDNESKEILYNISKIFKEHKLKVEIKAGENYDFSLNF